ncbi:class II aldolase/adducin family protein [Methanogenium sp. S4BF]|uniref:class II aldolase/adducin family protein n=1 Tax=Methanogenium sp. S4BF TaxID=1789226 RepID=UPI00241799F1|nr:class II aldolase/adducin family protein [Methanogenium sp. S4BF]WFN34865.1 class II aldolase/adducin family protein [Methanogenium sp. S4BF]
MHDIEFLNVGTRLHQEGLVTSVFGNMSRRVEGGFEITPTGSFLDVPARPVFVSDEGVPEAGASSEYRVHLQVYRRTDAGAIVHAHPPYAVALSLSCPTIVPVDSEGKMLLPEIPVVDGEPGTETLAENIGAALVSSPLVIARGHGTFARAETLVDAYILTAVAEHAARILSISAASDF